MVVKVRAEKQAVRFQIFQKQTMYSGDFHQKAVITSNNACAGAGLGTCAQVPTRSRATGRFRPEHGSTGAACNPVCRGYRFTVPHRESGKRGAGGKPIQPESPPNRATRGRLLGAPLPPHRLILGVSRVRPCKIPNEPLPSESHSTAGLSAASLRSPFT